MRPYLLVSRPRWGFQQRETPHSTAACSVMQRHQLAFGGRAVRQSVAVRSPCSGRLAGRAPFELFLTLRPTLIRSIAGAVQIAEIRSQGPLGQAEPTQERTLRPANNLPTFGPDVGRPDWESHSQSRTNESGKCWPVPNETRETPPSRPTGQPLASRPLGRSDQRER